MDYRLFQVITLVACFQVDCYAALTLNLIFIFDLHLTNIWSNCTDLNLEALRHVTMLEYAVNRSVLNHTEEEVKIGTRIVDTCGSADICLQELHSLIDGSNDGDQLIQGIIINSSKNITTSVVQLASLFSIPVINVAPIVETDDISTSRDSVVNMAPSRQVISDAITAFLKQKDVSYVQAITSRTEYHRQFLEILNERTSLRDCCVVTDFEISRNLSSSEMDKLLDGLLLEARFSPGTIMLTTREDFLYLLEQLAKRTFSFGPLFIGLYRPPLDCIRKYRRTFTGATFFQNVFPSSINSTDFYGFVNRSLATETENNLIPPTSCQYIPIEKCHEMLLDWKDVDSDFVSSYIQAAVETLIQGAMWTDKRQAKCKPREPCHQRLFHQVITNPKACEGNMCPDANPATFTFDVFSVTLARQLIEAGNVVGMHSYVEWPTNAHLNQYWAIMNQIREEYRSECRSKIRNKYAIVNKDSADAYIIGVLHNHKEKKTPSGCDEDGVHREHILRTEAILYAVDQINARTDLLRNVKLGAIIIDSCYITNKTVQQVINIVNGYVRVKNHFGLLSVPIGMVGPSSSGRTTEIAPAIQAYNIPIVSFSASSAVLSDKHLYPLFFRPIASDVKQAEAMVDLLKHYGWTYFGCVFSSTDYGTYGIREVIQQAYRKGMKVAYQVQIDDSQINDEQGFDHVFQQFILHRKHKVNVIAAFLETRHAEAIFAAAERFNLTGIVWVGSDSFTDSDSIAQSKFALGSIGVVFHTGILQDFGRYIDSINARNYTRDPFYLDLVESNLNCHLRAENRLRFPTPCPEDSRLVYSDISNGGEASPTIDCVLSLAHGFDFLLSRYCDGTFCSEAKDNIRRIPSMMTEVIFKGTSGDEVMFDSKGDGVGRYDFINLQQPEGGNQNNYVKFATWETGHLSFISSPEVLNGNGDVGPATDIRASCTGNCPATSADIVGMEYAYKPGNLMIHALLPVHFYDASTGACSSKLVHSGFEAVVAALWAVDMINRQNFLPDLKIGIAVYDTCSSPHRARQIAHEIVEYTFVVARPPEIPTEDTLIGLIGSTNDDETLSIEGQRIPEYSQNKVPLISMTSSILPQDLASDVTFFRTVPPTDAEIHLIIQLLKRLNWDYVHLVYTASLSKNETVKRFAADASRHGLCVATKIPLNSAWEELTHYTDVVHHMMNVTGATGVVLMTDDFSTERLLTAAKDAGAHGKLFWISTESWRHTTWISRLQDIAIDVMSPDLPESRFLASQIALGEASRMAVAVTGTLPFTYRRGALTIAPNQTINTNFGKYFTSLSIVNGSDIAWFKDFWQSHFSCNLARGTLFEKTCMPNMKLNISGDYKQSWETPAIINAVYAYAHAAKSLADKCSANKTLCNDSIVDYLDHVRVTEELPFVNFAPPGGVSFFFRDRSGQGSFEVFNMQPHRGSFRFIQVGKYNNGQLELSMHHTGMYQNGRRLIPKSKCPGQCKVCLTDKFLAEYEAHVKVLEAAGPPLYHHLNRAIGIIMISLLCLGIGFTALLIFYLYKLWSSRMAFMELSIDASITLIGGVLLLYLSNITFLFSATNGTCAVRRIFLGIAYCLCFSAQLMDVARLAILRQLKGDAPAHDVLKSKRIHIYIPVLLAGQVVPTIFWLLLEPSGALLNVPLPQDIASLDEVISTWRCKIDRYELVCSLAYDAVLLLHTMLLAFINRHVTTGYGVCPARSILLSNVVSAGIWVAWIPLYLHLENNDAYLALVSVGISLDATFMLGINFMPKVITLMDQMSDHPLPDLSCIFRARYAYRSFMSRKGSITHDKDRRKSPDEVSESSDKTTAAERPSSLIGIIRIKGSKNGLEKERGASFRRILPKRPDEITTV